MAPKNSLNHLFDPAYPVIWSKNNWYKKEKASGNPLAFSVCVRYDLEAKRDGKYVFSIEILCISVGIIKHEVQITYWIFDTGTKCEIIHLLIVLDTHPKMVAAAGEQEIIKAVFDTELYRIVFEVVA